VVPDTADETAPAHPSEPEDVIGSPPTRLDDLISRVDSRVPQSYGRAAVLAVAVVAAMVGLLIGYQLTPGPRIAEPAGGTTAPAVTDSEAASGSLEAGLGRGLLTLADLAATGELASGGTYTRGSASALPDPCAPVAPGAAGVSYLPGPRGATAVSFRIVGGSVTERVTVLADDAQASSRLRASITSARTCPIDSAVTVELAAIGPGLGEESVPVDETVHVLVHRDYPSGSSTTVSVLLIRVGAVLVEFSLAGPSSTATDSSARCLTFARAGLSL